MMSALRSLVARDRQPLADERTRALSLALQEEFSAPFALYDGTSGERLADRGESRGSPAAPRGLPPEALAIAAGGRPHVGHAGDAFRLVVPIREADGAVVVAIGDVPALARSATAARLEQARLQKWLQSVQSRLSFAARPTIPQADDSAQLRQLRSVLEASRELTDLLAGLEGLGESGDEPARILRRAAAALRADARIWVPARDDEPAVLDGDVRFSPDQARELARWLAGGPGWEDPGYLIANEAAASVPGARPAGLLNLMALSAGDREAGGWLIVANKRDAEGAPGRDGPDRPAVVAFRRIDVALLKPFASLLGLQSRSSRRQGQVQDLFAGLVRSLTAAIDAKDPYTCGHSERVARIAVELAREMGLSEADQGDVYLAGLLHDIGKIGVPDSVLGKPGSLTAEEFLRIAEHVRIGCRILEGFDGIAHLLPAVLAHHERYDGTGYPRGLKGEAIPLVGRILAVADCFDAMDSPRPYRAPMPRDQIESTLAQGRGRHWDGQVIDAFFRARERIHAIHPRGIGDSVWFALHPPERGFQPHFPGRGAGVHDLELR